MKRRSDFVSNSSSSSFILYDSPIFEYFKIDKQEIINALTDLMTSKYVEDYKSTRKKWLKENPDYVDEMDRKYPDDCGPFYVYDLNDDKDKKIALDKWGNLLEDWDCRDICKNEDGSIGFRDDYDKPYEKAAEALAKIYGLNHYDGIIKDSTKNKDITCWIRTEKRQKNGCYGYDVSAPKEVIKILRDIRKKCGIITNKDLIQEACSRFFVHFDENELWLLKDSQVCSKNDTLYKKPENDYQRKHNKEVKNSKYVSQSYSQKRIFEILFNYWIEKGKIKRDDKKFLKIVFPMSDYQKEKKKKDPDKYSYIKYSTKNEVDLSYLDLNDEVLSFEGHEG